MKAIILKGFWGVENLIIINVPVPDVSDNAVLVKVKAIGINPAPGTHLALKPANISHEIASAASLAAFTAWQILKEKTKVKMLNPFTVKREKTG